MVDIGTSVICILKLKFMTKIVLSLDCIHHSLYHSNSQAEAHRHLLRLRLVTHVSKEYNFELVI